MHEQSVRSSEPLRAAAGAPVVVRGCATAGAGDGERAGGFHEAFARLLESVETEAGLHARGLDEARGALRDALAQHRRLVRLLESRPAFSRAEVRNPVFLTGLPGSGAALLHNLLALHPGLDAPARWELARFPGEPMLPRDRRTALARERARAARTARLTQGRDAGHFPRAEDAGGCHQLLTRTGHSMAAAFAWRVPGYAAWLEGADLTESYALHRAQIQAAAWRMPGGTLVLRDPFHSRYLKELLRAYPDARVVQVHRGAADLVATCSGISAALRGRGVPDVDRRALGTEWADRVERHIRDSERVRAAVPPGQLLDVRHQDLVSDPVGETRRVLRFAGMPRLPSVEGAVAALAARTAQAAGAAPAFRPAEFGLSRRHLNSRFAVYRTTYGV